MRNLVKVDESFAKNLCRVLSLIFTNHTDHPTKIGLSTWHAEIMGIYRWVEKEENLRFSICGEDIKFDLKEFEYPMQVGGYFSVKEYIIKKISEKLTNILEIRAKRISANNKARNNMAGEILRYIGELKRQNKNLVKGDVFYFKSSEFDKGRNGRGFITRLSRFNKILLSDTDQEGWYQVVVDKPNYSIIKKI